MKPLKNTLFIILTVLALSAMGQNTDRQKIILWPGNVPGEMQPKHEPEVMPDKGDKITRLSNVTNPALLVFDACRNCNGSAVIICPGGGYGILAIDLEGYEIATWLNSLGITAFVLQYRVPDKRDAALQDLQRAVRVVRENAGNWNLDPDKIGVMGFSAGASLSARICALPDTSLYPATDQADKLRFRPDYCMLVYPAYLDDGPGKSISPETTPAKATPPAFIFATADDPHGNSALVMASALRNAQKPVELHFLPYGGHGYGLRKGNRAAETWPALAQIWLNTILKGTVKPPLNHEE
jgi:acetyl esterase/lipase